MKYKKIEMGAYNIHFIKTNKFKTVEMKINFKREVKKEETSYRSLISEILLKSSKKYKTGREMVIADENLYGILYDSGAFNSGRYNIVNFNFTFLSEKYTEKGMYEKTIEFISELLLNPNINKNGFDLEELSLTKQNLYKMLEAAKETPTYYIRQKLFENMDENKPVSYNDIGYKDIIEKITKEQLYNYYKEMLKKDIIDIFIIGDIDEYELKKIIEKNFNLNTFKKATKSHYITDNKVRFRSQTINEKSDFKQTYLYMGYNVVKPNMFETHYVSQLYNCILGASPDSKLFKTVREKHSLCYSINSSNFLVNNMMLIKTGINKKNIELATNLIKKEIKNIVLGKFTEEDLTKAKVIYISSLKKMSDSPQAILNLYISKEYLNLDLIEDRIININKVTKKDIIAYAKKIKLNTSYILEGDEENE